MVDIRRHRISFKISFKIISSATRTKTSFVPEDFLLQKNFKRTKNLIIQIFFYFLGGEINAYNFRYASRWWGRGWMLPWQCDHFGDTE
jgi:hypothetical protein